MRKTWFLYALVLILILSSCTPVDEDKDGAKSTPTLSIRTEAPGTTETPDKEPTSEPTEEPSPEPVPTVEPGKETYAEGIKGSDKGPGTLSDLQRDVPTIS